MSDVERHLHGLQAEGQSKFIYFQLGAAASAIAFAVHVTRDAVLAVSHWPLGVAVALWGGSFWIGLEAIRTRLGIIRLNMGRNQLLNESPMARAQITAVTDPALDKESGRGASLFNWQTRTLLLGGMAFVVWHIWTMAGRAA